MVTTSSTRTAAAGGRPARRTRGGAARRSDRGRPTCRLPCERRRQGAIGNPVWALSAAAIASAASNPRHRRRAGAGGTGTIAPSSRSAGRSRGDHRARAPGERQPRPELQRRHQVPGDALIGRGRPGGVQARNRRRAGREPIQPGLASLAELRPHGALPPAHAAARRHHQAEKLSEHRRRSSTSARRAWRADCYESRACVSRHGLGRPALLSRGAASHRWATCARLSSATRPSPFSVPPAPIRRPLAPPPRRPPRSRSPRAPCRAPCPGP